MTGIIDRLVADFRFRLSAAGKKWRPKKQEIMRLGASKIPSSAVWLIWGAYMLFALAGAPALLNIAEGSWAWFAFQWPGWVVTFLGLNWLKNRLLPCQNWM